MSPKNSRLITAGLTVLGLFGFAPPGVADPTPPAPSGPQTSVAPTPSHAVLLLTNGRLCEGTLSENGTDMNYVLRAKGGTLTIPKPHVEKRGGSIREIYEYLLERLPPRDPDEHLKLAQWCLNQKMTPEATAQLKAVVKLSPEHPQALRMLDKIDGAEEREAQRDPAVTQANAEMANNRPDELDTALIGRAQRGLGISALPQIPGLPTALAVRCATNFSRYVDPILQNRCAKCHNEQFDGSFQLIRYKVKADRTTEARNANLDAVIALIDMENPAKSEFLSSTLRVHGNGSNARPIFRGANDPHYRILSEWVNSLRVPTGPTPPSAGNFAAAQPSRFGTPASSGGETFAAGRSGQMPLPPLTPTPAAPAAGRDQGRFDPSVSYGVAPPAFTPEQLEAIEYKKRHPDVAPGGEFPAPFAATGVPPKLEPAPAPVTSPRAGMRAGAEPSALGVPPKLESAPRAGAQGGTEAEAGTVPAAMPQFDPKTGAPLVPGLPPGTVAKEEAAALQAAAAEAAAAEAKAANSATPKKPVKLQPSLLEKALMNRYAPQP